MTIAGAPRTFAMVAGGSGARPSQPLSEYYTDLEDPDLLSEQKGEETSSLAAKRRKRSWIHESDQINMLPICM